MENFPNTIIGSRKSPNLDEKMTLNTNSLQEIRILDGLDKDFISDDHLNYLINEYLQKDNLLVKEEGK